MDNNEVFIPTEVIIEVSYVLKKYIMLKKEKYFNVMLADANLMGSPILGYSPTIFIDEGIKRTIEYYNNKKK